MIDISMNMTEEQMLFWGVGSYLLLMIGYSTFYSYRVGNWPYVVGLLIEAKVSSSGGMEFGHKYESVKYEYEVDGRQYSGNRLSPMQFRGNVGRTIEKQLSKIQYVSEGQVKVFYNPKKPQKSYLVCESILDFFRS